MRVGFVVLILAPLAGCLLAHKTQSEPFGRRPMSTRAAFEQLPADGGRSRVTSLTDNAEAWVARWQLLGGARDRIDVTYFIVDQDVFGMAFLGHLYKKAIDGIKVRVLVDGRGSSSFITPGVGKKDFLQELVSTGLVEVRIYNPPLKQIAKAFVQVGARSSQALAGTHNKILIADNARAITGGRNIARSYYASAAEEQHGFYDADVFVTGAAVQGIADAMNRDLQIVNREDIDKDLMNFAPKREELLMVYGAMDAWLKGKVPMEPLKDALFALEAAALAQLPTLPERSVRDAVRPHLQELALLHSLHGAFDMDIGTPHKSDVRVIGSGSLVQDDTDEAGEALLTAISGATSSIWIESPYFVLTPQVLEALSDASRRGVAIEIITNSALSTDNTMSASLFLDTWPELMARVPTMRVFVKSNLPTLHAKRAVFDDALTLIGSYNLDPLSAFVNSELIVAVWSPGFNDETRQQMSSCLHSGDMLEYTIDRDQLAQPRRHPRGHPFAGRVVVKFGPRDHVSAEQISSLVATKDMMIGIKDMWQLQIVVY